MKIKFDPKKSVLVKYALQDDKKLDKILRSANELLDKGFCMFCGKTTMMISVPKSGTFEGIIYLVCKNPKCGADIKAFINEYPKGNRK